MTTAQKSDCFCLVGSSIGLLAVSLHNYAKITDSIFLIACGVAAILVIYGSIKSLEINYQ